ncbi:hypothetical protein E4U43_002679 [Claviceps pusilla]|uniref:Uncharacterized protein n=1 Tax=Claviceps pusilla TaxID=123648 RepID=A0A9P7N6R2_9HYPO|nr:hypothetical protein E4U43_002679 [Claviceps pusilla]
MPKSPSLTRFLSDFTLGFSDGLTVPFALTAGLSSLGQTDTVVSAGLAEVCAGSISMGIGGYLSARDEVPRPCVRDGRDGRYSAGDDEDDEEEEKRDMLRRRDSGECVSSYSSSGSSSGSSSRESIHPHVNQESQARHARQEAIIQRHLEPLLLPDQTTLEILTLLRNRPDGIQGAALRVQKLDCLRDAGPATPAGMVIVSKNANLLPTWPVVSGLSISLGYIVGGIIPLLPYLFAATVGGGLQWSTAVCLLSLLAFGLGKSWLLGGEKSSWRTSLWEGGQMLVLGGFAAGAAVLCVNLLGRA